MSLLDDDKGVVALPLRQREPHGPDGQAKRTIPVLRQWDLKNQPELEDQIEGVIHARTLNMICAQKGQGKTQILVELGMCIAAGHSWAGRRVLLPGPVVYIIGEDADGLRGRVIASRMKLGMGERNLPFDVIEEPINLVRSAEDLNSVIVAIMKLGYSGLGAIMLDTYSTVIGGEKEDEKTGGAVAGAGQALCRWFGCSVFIAHHEGKDKSKGPRGSGVVQDRCSTSISCTLSGNIISLTDVYQRNRPNKLFRPRFRTETISYEGRDGRRVEVPRAAYIVEDVTDTGDAIIASAKPESFLNAKQQLVWKGFKNALASDKGFTGAGTNIPHRRCVNKSVWRDEAVSLDFYSDPEPEDQKDRRKWVDNRAKNFNDVVLSLVHKGMCSGYGSGQTAVYWMVA